MHRKAAFLALFICASGTLLVGCTATSRPAAESSASPAAAPTTPCPAPPGIPATPAEVGNKALADGEDDLAKNAYTLVQTTRTSTPADLACAVVGLKVLADRTNKPSGASAPASAWDTFFKTWVSPTLRFLVPFLVVTAVLLVAARLAPSLLVGVNEQSWQTRGLANRTLETAGFAVAGAALLAAGVGAVITIPHTSANAPPVTYGTWLPLTLYGIGLTAAAGVTASFRLGSRLRKKWPTLAVTVLGIATLVTITHPHSLHTWGAALGITTFTAIAGVVLLARMSGLGLGVQIIGYASTGQKDPGLAAHVLSRLSALGSQPPRGIQITQQTDVSSLPDDALKLLPDTTFGKAIALISGILVAPPPWTAEITEQTTETPTLCSYVTERSPPHK